MKRITLILAAIICLAITAMAQENQPVQINADQPLSPALWKQGIATCAHYTACDRRFGKKIDEIKSQFPQGYTLDNLNDEIYGGQGRKWEKIYNEFKKEESRGGSINDLKELVSPQIWNLVEPDFTAFITEHPELANAVPDAANPGDENSDETQENNGEETTAGVTKTTGNSGSGISCNANLPLWLGILGSLLGLCALLTALSNRGKVKELQRNFARELERTNANLQEFSTDAADQIKALSIRLTGKAARLNDTDPIVAQVSDETMSVEQTDIWEPDIEQTDIEEPVDETDDEAVQQDLQQEGEVLNLFTSKPDENDDFTRVSDTFEPGNSIYVLTTFDGQHGKFEVIDKPEVHRFALMMPAENLIRACSGNAIQIPSGNRIVTDRPGEAEFIDGHWHVVVKAIIHYEN